MLLCMMYSRYNQIQFFLLLKCSVSSVHLVLITSVVSIFTTHIILVHLTSYNMIMHGSSLYIDIHTHTTLQPSSRHNYVKATVSVR